MTDVVKNEQQRSGEGAFAGPDETDCSGPGELLYRLRRPIEGYDAYDLEKCTVDVRASVLRDAIKTIESLPHYDYERDIVPILDKKAAAEGRLAGLEDLLIFIGPEAFRTAADQYENPKTKDHLNHLANFVTHWIQERDDARR